MQFFSRYSYIWRFPKEQEEQYNLFVRPSNLTSLRLVTFITIFGMSLFLLIDYFKAVDFTIVLGSRIVVLSGAASIMWFSHRNLSSTAIIFCVSMIVVLNFGAALVTATFAGMPSFYLTNLLFLIFLLVVTASGLHFRHALIVNTICLISFLIYSQYINRDPFYFSQYPHLFSIFVYIHIVGVVLENRRRKNFIQFNHLEEQKRLVEELNQQKNKVISILSHDVASPLSSLSAILHLHTKRAIDESELNRYMIKLREEFDNVSFLLHSLVRWSRSQIHGFVLDKTTINLIEVLENKIKVFQTQLLDKNLELILKAEDSVYVEVDKEMTLIALRNVISNAIKFAKTGSQIQLEVSRKNQRKVVVSIKNEGEPIPLELREKLFTYQMPSLEDTKGERGTGLGLALSSFFIRLNGGDIYLGNTEEGMTEFCLEFQHEPAQSA